MIVLDADSLMTGDTLVRLVAAMEQNPKVGLIQTFPVMVNATTPFARVQQFAGRLYGPLIAYGSRGGMAATATTGATTPSSARAPSRNAAGFRC
jgi:cellulose synthase/poly-beta-1,6-N-acetylglucosamine synthase-like glycosyltransferase